MRKLKRNQVAPEDSPETKAMMVRAIEAPQVEQSQEMKALQMLQAQLMTNNLQLGLNGSRKNLR